MFSIESYLRDVVNQHLSEWIQEIPESNLEVGLLSGSVKLENLHLQRKTLNLDEHYNITIEKGSIESLRISIPWSQLHYASSHVEAEGLQVVVKLGFNEHNKKSDTSEDQHAKMHNMKLKEAELLRNLTSSSTWMNQFSSTIANTALYKLVENFKLDIKRITMIVLIPISEWDEWYAFTVTMDSFSVGNSCTEDVRNQLQKEVLLRNFTLYFQYMKGDINTELASLGVTPPIPDILLRSRQPSFVLDHLIETLLSRKIGLLISPISFSLTINLHRRFNTMPSFSNLHQVEIALDIQGLEVRISMQELQQLLDVLNFVSIERIKARQLKKSIFQSHTSKSPALYWQYTYQAITTILQLHRGFDKVKLKQDLNQRIFSKQYAQQYHYYLCQQLQQYEVDMSKYIDEDDINEDYDEELLTKGEQELTVNALLATRMKVYFALLERQLPLRWLVHVLSHEDDHQQHLPKFISIRDRVQMSRLANDIKRQRQSVDVNGQKRLHFEEIPSIRAGDAGNSQIKKLNWKLQVAMDRLNLAVYASPHPHHHQQGGHSNTTTTSKRTSKHAYSTSKSHPRDNKFLAGNNTKKTSQASVSFSTTSTSAPLPVNINNRQDLLIKVTVNNIGLVMDSHGKKEELVVRLGIGSCQLFGVDKFCFMTWGNVEHTKSLADFKISIQQHACHGMQEFIQQHAFWLQIRTNKKMYNPHPIISNEVDDNDVDDKLNTEEVLPEEEDNSSGIYAGSIPHSKKISKFERSIYTFDVGGTVSHAFLKPTQSSINISLHCHDLNVVWDQKSFNKLGKTMKDLRIGLSSVVPTTVCSAEKMLLAQLSQYQSMDGVIEEPPKLNLEVSLDSVRVLFPIKQRNQHSLQHIQQMREEERILGDDDRCLQIFIQHVDIMSGDKVNVIAGVESRTTGLSADQSMEGGEEEERDRKDEKEQGVGEKDSDDDDDVSVTSNEHESSTSHSRTKFSSALEVKKLLEKLKNEIIRPHVFSVQEIHVGYSFVFLHAHLGCNMQCYYPTSRREIVSGSLPKIVDLPWNISGCWCPSIAMNHVNYTNHRLDIFCENLRMRVDTQDIIYMMRAVETCTHHHGNTSTTSHNKASNSALVMPRIQRLSGLSKLYLSVVLHAIEISFVDNKLKVDSIEEEATLLQKILLKYANGIQQHWDDAVINKVCRESSVRRFHNAGLSYFQALHILDLLRNAMTERHKVYSETELVGIITSVVMNYLHSKPAHRHLSHHQIEREDVLFKVKVSTVDMQFHQLTYDCKLWCFVRSLVLYDNYRTSICEFKIAQTSSASTSASPSPSDPQRRKSKLSEETSSKRRRHHGIVNPQSHQHHESQLVTKLQKSALNFVMIAKDDAHSFGQGGLHVRDVYGHIDNAWRGRRGSSTFDIALGCSNCWLEYDAKHIFAILMETTLIFDRIRTAVDTTRMKQHSATHSSPVQQQHSTSTKTSLPPHKANSPSKSGDNPILHVAAIRMEVDMKGFSVTLSNADKPFNHLNLVGCKVQLINTTGKFSIDGTVKSLSLYDLTLLGKLHRNVLWKQSNNSENSTKSEKFIEEPVLSFSISDELDALTGNSELRVTGHMSHLRVCFLYRFLTEILIYISVCIAQPMAKVWEGSGMAVDTSSKPMMRRTTGDLNIFQLEEDDEGSDEEMYDDMDLDMEPFSPAGYPDRNSVRLSTRTPPISSPPTVPAVKKIYIEVHLHELQGFVPRNSSSTDVIGLRIDHAMAKIYFTAKPWEAPDSNIPRNADQTGHLYFNTDVDGWVYGSGHHPANLNSTSTNLDTDDFFDAMEGDDQKHGHGGSAQTTSADDVLRIVAQLDNIFIFTTLCNENDTRKKRPYRVDSFLELLNVEDIAPGYHDCSHGHHVRVRQDTAWNHMASMQRWIQNSRSGFNLLMVLDISSEEVKLLFGDTASVSCLDVATSQAEFYLLVALWFDNIFEKEEYVQYTASKPVSASTTSAESDGRNSNSSNSFHPYGSKEYFTSILGRSSYFDLMVVRANVAIACATEVKYYSSSGPNAEYLKSLQKYDRERLCDLHPNFKVGNNEDNYLAPNYVSMMSASRRTMSSSSRQTLSGREVIPIAEAQAKSILLHVKNDSDGTRLFISGSDLIAFDCRQSTSTIHPLILRLASLRNKTKDEDLKYYSLFERNEVYHYGFTDFSFGLNSNSMNFQHHHQVPFQFSLLRSAASNWMTMNIGVDGADIKLEKVDLALLLADFFSVYFRFPEYGHPGVTAYTKLPPKDIPYGATDLRLFITRPHLAFVQNPMQLNSPALLVEADRGIYFRYIGDTAESTKFYLNGNDLAAVLVKRYRPPVVYRGARGSSGSGRGVRTTLEFLNFVFFYHYCAANHQSNIKFEIFNPEPEADENMARCADQVLDIYDETFGTDSIEIPEPTCLQSITQVKKEFPAASCDIVTCYEDIVFSVDVIKKFLSVGETKVSSPKSSHGSSNGNNSKPVSPTHQVKAPLIRSTGEQEKETVGSTTPNPANMYVIGVLSGIRFMLVDNVLGLHLPLFQLFLDSMNISLDKRLTTLESNESDGSSPKRRYQRPRKAPVMQFESNQFAIASLWMEYFNNLKKCWEPLLEKVVFHGLMKKSDDRGIGINIRSESAIHLNLTGALIRTFYDALRTLQAKEIEANSTDHVSNLHAKMLQGLTKMEEYNADLPNDFSSSKDDLSVSSRRAPVGDQPQMNSTRASMAMAWGRSVSTTTGYYERIEDGKDFNGQVSDNNNTIIHIPSFPIDHTFRVGFSILNLTGQPVRYLQQWSNGKKTVQYLNDGERGLLNFVAAQTLIRNGTIIEETFDVQQDHASQDSRERNRKKLVGNHVALQVCGYRWLHSVQADELGTRFEDLVPVLGRVNPSLVGDEDITGRLLKLMVEVVPYCGGRMLRLHSVFTVRNNTSHKIHILAKEPDAFDDPTNNDYMSTSNGSYQNSNWNKEIPFELDAGEDLHIPIALLHRSIIASRGTSLGSLFIKPTELSPIEEELEARLDLVVGQVDYSPDPINLLQIATSNRLQGGGRNNTSDVMQLCCHVNPKHRGNKRTRRIPTKNQNATEVDNNNNNIPVGNGDSPYGPLSSPSNDFNKLPPFCYNVEIASALKAEFVNRNFFTPNNISPSNPCNFTIVIHPPIQIENLLSCSAVFEIVHAVQKRVLWSACVPPGCVKPIHTVTLEEPLLLLINLRYCRASEGVMIHEPKKTDLHKKGLAKKLQRTLEGFLEENDREEVLSMNLTDTEGQKLRLHVENNEGAGGQKHIVVYCPYWVVNTSQYSYRIREEGEIDLPAGTQTSQKDGTRPIPSSISSFPDDNNVATSRFSTPNAKANPRTANDRRVSIGQNNTTGNAGNSTKKFDVVFPGCRGPLHHADMRVKNSDGVAGIPMTDPLCRLLNDLSFEDILCLGYMFNFREDSTLLNNGKKVKFQLEDTDWSRSFSLESVGVNQVLQVEDSQKGILEVGFKISVAPGRLAKYTKIVRLLPRYTIVNALKNDRLVKIIQPDGFVEGKGGGDVIISPNSLISYHLPVLFGERKLSLQLEGPWKKTVPFNIDQIGSFTLEVKRHFDLASIPHVNTRGAPEYIVELPSNRTIGIFFETDWGEKNIVVKGFQKGGFAELETDIKVGDVLIAVDHEPVDGKKFELAMNILKNKLSRDSCSIKLRTVEEKLRMIRDEAMKNTKGKTRTTRFGMINSPSPSLTLSPKSMSSEGNNQFVDLEADELASIAVKVELRPVESSIMVIVNELDKDSNTDYRIENRSGAYRIHFKQKGVNGNSWTTLHPGQTCAFVWEDPFKPHKLQLHVGDNVLCPSDNRNSRYLKEVGDVADRSNAVMGVGEDKLGIYLSFIGVGGDSATVLNLDEIGSETVLPINRSDTHLLATIKSEGPTKILYILPNLDPKIIAHELQYCSSFAQMKNVEIQKCIQYLQSIQDAMLDMAAVRIGSVSETVQLYVHDALEQLRNTQRNELKSLGGFGMAERNMDVSSGPSQRLPTDLVTPKYIDRLIEAGIDRPHQLLVDILEAKELPAMVVGKAEDIYCKLYLKGQERTSFLQRNFSQQTFATYVCEQTFEPTWLQQRFVFDIPSDAVKDHRGLNLRIHVKAKNMVGLDAVLAKLDVPFSCLREEEIVEGWFPLRPSRASTAMASISDEDTSGAVVHSGHHNSTTGSIRLRLQWVHSDLGYIKYYLQSLLQRKQELIINANIVDKIHSTIVELLNRKDIPVSNTEWIAFEPPLRGYYDRLIRQSLSAMRRQMDIVSESIHRDEVFEDEDLIDDGHVNNPMLLASPPFTRFAARRKSAMQLVQPHREFSNVSATDVFINDRDHLTSLLPSPINTLDQSNFSLFDDLHSPQPTIAMDEEEEEMIPVISQKKITSRHSLEVEAEESNLGNITCQHHHDRIMTTWMQRASPHKAFHKLLSNEMMEASSFYESREKFHAMIRRESSRHYHHVLAQTGTIEVIPMQALHVPETGHHTHVKMTYGKESFTSFSVPPAAYLTWFQDEWNQHLDSSFHANNASHEVDGGGATTDFSPGFRSTSQVQASDTSTISSASNVSQSTTASSTNMPSKYDKTIKNLAKNFEVDLLNIRGSIRIRIISETFPKYREVARVELPIAGIIDSTCLLNGDYYERWYPLTLNSDSKHVFYPCEDYDKARTMHVNEADSQAKFGYQPCISIRLRWIPSSTTTSSSELTKFYGKLTIPRFSFALLDSEHARSVMLATVLGVELRRAVTKTHTDLSMNVTHLQVDNQLPDPQCDVILAPTPVKSPQPVLRIHVRRKNNLSQANLACYETVQIVVQELDVRLEQQTVLASWELVKNWLHEQRIGSSNIDEQLKMSTSSSSQALPNGLSRKPQPQQSGGGDVRLGNSLGEFYQQESDSYRTSTSNSTSFRTTIFSRYLQKSNYESDEMNDGEHVQYNVAQERMKANRQDIDVEAGNTTANEDMQKFIDDRSVHKLYIENFKIFPIKLNVSFLTTPQYIVQRYRTDQRQALLRSERSLGIYSAVSLFLWQVGEVVLDLTSSISDAPIFFNGFELTHLFKTYSDVQRTLQEHYLLHALGQLYKIVGSLDLVGNPIGLLSSLGVGVRDFFYEPAHALITSPTEIGKIGKGVVKGTVSLVSNTTVGFLGTGTTITRSIGRGFAKLSMDASYMKAREKLQATPVTVRENIMRPIRDVGNGFYYGVAGLVKVPYQSVKRHGPAGIIPGVAKGVAGLAADPIVGILDAVTHSGDAFREIIKSSNKERSPTMNRMRLSTCFGPDGRVLQYEPHASFGTYVLNILNKAMEDHHHGKLDLPISPDAEGGNTPTPNMLSSASLPQSRSSRHRSDSVLSLEETPSKARSNSVLESFTPILRAASHHSTDERSNAEAKAMDLLGFHRFAEFVVHTAILHKSSSAPWIIIISTKRIFIVEYVHKTKSVKQKYVTSLEDLSHGTCERSGTGVTVVFVGKGSTKDRSNANTSNSPLDMMDKSISTKNTKLDTPSSADGNTKRGKKDSTDSFAPNADGGYTLAGNYQEEDILINLTNCFNTIKRRFNTLHSVFNDYYDNCREDENTGVRQIGPWQFTNDLYWKEGLNRKSVEEETTLFDENRQIIKLLQAEDWHCPPDEEKLKSSNKPAWLLEETINCLHWHQLLKEIYHVCSTIALEMRSNPKSKTLFKTHLEELKSGRISYKEFLVILDKTKKLLAENEDLADDLSINTDRSERSKPTEVDKAKRKLAAFFGFLANTTTLNFNKDDASTTESSKRSIFQPSDDQSAILRNMRRNDEKSTSPLMSFTPIMRSISPPSATLFEGTSPTPEPDWLSRLSPTDSQEAVLH